MIEALAETRTEVHYRNNKLVSTVRRPDLSGYNLLAKIGQGGMGIVYLAQSAASTRRCAVKVMRPDVESVPNNVRRFQFEISALKQVSHPNIVRLLDAGQADNGSPYFAMDYLNGRDLADVLRQDGSLCQKRVLSVMRQLCGALEQVHGRGLVQNDIKPGNIIVDGGVGCELATLIDFGL